MNKLFDDKLIDFLSSIEPNSPGDDVVEERNTFIEIEDNELICTLEAYGVGKDIIAMIPNFKYIKLICGHFPLYDDTGLNTSFLPVRYIHNRQKILSELPSNINQEEFYSFQHLQNCITALELEPQPLFEYIAFSYYRISNYIKYKTETCRERIINCAKLINEEYTNDKPSMMIAIGKNKISFNNENFIKSLLSIVYNNNYKCLYLIEKINKVTRERTIQYYLIKSIMDFLPIKAKREAGAKFNQTERDFYLCILHFCGLLLGEEDFVCSKDNNVTFDNLIRTFQESTIPYSEIFEPS